MTSTLFFFKSHYIKNLNNDFRNKLILTQEIKKNYDLIERVLIPTHLSYFRMNSGLPIFIDWKHHAFRFDQLIEWEERINLANKFYSSRFENDQLFYLKKIQNIEKISHILIKKNELKKDCKDLINHKVFALVSINDCYKNKF
jgi:hypothetical protein